MRKAALLIASVAAAAFTSEAMAETVQALPANRFVNFIGVNTHLNWKGTIWETGADKWRPRLGELGVRYIRTAMARTPFARDNLNFLHSQYGIRANVLMEPRATNGSLDPSQVRPLLDYLRDEVGREKVTSFEGPNEYSESKYSRGNTGWAAQVREYQRFLYTTVKGDPTWRDHTVIGPTVWRRFVTDYEELGNLSAFADAGNLHYYNGGRKPSLYPREHAYTNLMREESSVAQAIADAQKVVPRRRIFITETGFNMRRVYPPTGWYVPERAAAKYTLRLVADLFLERGSVKKAYIFSLIDEGSEKIYGLLRAPDLSPRPAFYALKNTISLLFEERRRKFSPEYLTYSLAGEVADVRVIVLQKNDGRFYMVLWNDVISYDQSRKIEVDPKPARVALEFGGRVFTEVSVYYPTGIDRGDPNDGARPIQTLKAVNSLALDVPDHLTIIELIP